MPKQTRPKFQEELEWSAKRWPRSGRSRSDRWEPGSRTQSVCIGVGGGTTRPARVPAVQHPPLSTWWEAMWELRETGPAYHEDGRSSISKVGSAFFRIMHLCVICIILALSKLHYLHLHYSAALWQHYFSILFAFFLHYFLHYFWIILALFALIALWSALF